MSETTLTIESMGAKGDGMALHEGARLAVPFALPGEKVRVALEGERATLLAVIEASPERVSPACPHFGACGGCVVQHWQGESIAQWKRARVQTALSRAGLEVEVAPTRDGHGAGRRRVTLHVRRKDSQTLAGFMQARSHALIDLDTCPLLVPALAPAPQIARAIGHILRGLEKPLDVQVTAVTEGLDVDIRGAGRIDEGLRQKLVRLAMDHGSSSFSNAFSLTRSSGSSREPATPSLENAIARLTLHGERLVEARVPSVMLEGTDLRAFIPPGAFLQPTSAGEALLADLAGEALKGAKHVAETFCGLGPFGLRLARRMKVTAYDSERGAIEAFARSIRANPGGKPCVAEARDLFRRPLFAPELKSFDAMLLDPPRQGAEAQMREVAKSKLARVAYVSCDPESFARDARIAVEAGFKLNRVTPVDQFRFSAHVELVAEFSR